MKVPEWVYLMAVFIALTVGYGAGFAAGSWKTDRAPNANVWLNVRKYGADMNREIQLRQMELEHEEQMEMIRRGVFDPMNVGLPPEDEDDSD